MHLSSKHLIFILIKDLKKVLQASLVNVSHIPNCLGSVSLQEQKRSNYIVELHSLVVKFWPSCHFFSVAPSHPLCAPCSFRRSTNNSPHTCYKNSQELLLLARAQLLALLNLKITGEKLRFQQRNIQEMFLHHMQQLEQLKEMNKQHLCAYTHTFYEQTFIFCMYGQANCNEIQWAAGSE